MNLTRFIETFRQSFWAELLALPNIVIFLISVLLSLIVGRYTPTLVRFVIHRVSKEQVSAIYDGLIDPIRGVFRMAGTSILILLSLAWLQEDYLGLHNFLEPFAELAVIASLAWLASCLFRQFVRVYGIDLLRRLGREVDELLLVLETLVNLAIGFIAVIAFAQSQQFNLVGLVASLGIGGLAIAFAAQKILEQLLSTIVLYLDRPFIPGDYIRVALNPHAPDVYGRIESIGLRSTKLRTSAKSTVVVIPNSILANLDIENITRGKKVMVMLYLDFEQPLDEQDAALVKQVVTQSTESLFGIDPGSTSISFTTVGSDNGRRPSMRARTTFFILGSSENSIELRKRLLELASDKIAKKLSTYGIKFTVEEPTIYVESPVTI
ncbi:mechanosensitive ion channel [Romeria aff. gracilis LEGE 07310]|uniref:Mechanosensitive ion channel n=1 Tax=Vasconcelosia minhoensis LEGE 07310 TaxID=915328 RepID=A0A8J7AIX6_9CYAN|nr:mechanosensitive ion channel domain-containing protein [Romeria gracilis]MBE9079799.1 mechanosensitive ion channel [Romeria aff. gracilis LEGE 07310]